MDEKTFVQAMKKQSIPPFSMLIENIIRQMQGRPPDENPAQIIEIEQARADIMEKQARAAKTEAERLLTIEKIATERLEQQVRLAGIKYDEEELKIRRAEVVAQISKSLNDNDEKPSSKERPGIYREKGMKSNNEEVLNG
jgi:hypothetical protein